MRKSLEDEESGKDRSVACEIEGYLGADLSSSGDRIIVVVQKQRSFGEGSVGTSAANKVRRGDIRHAVVVRTKKKLQRPDGSVVKFDDNACVLINKAGEPIGTRLNGEFSSVQPGHGTNMIDRCCRKRVEEDEVVEDSVFGPDELVKDVLYMKKSIAW